MPGALVAGAGLTGPVLFAQLPAALAARKREGEQRARQHQEQLRQQVRREGGEVGGREVRGREGGEVRGRAGGREVRREGGEVGGQVRWEAVPLGAGCDALLLSSVSSA